VIGTDLAYIGSAFVTANEAQSSVEQKPGIDRRIASVVVAPP
jgi:NAD(P)H-dependent flavin oxidoreductase YrpB (nitropropane dioxygenase family)